RRPMCRVAMLPKSTRSPCRCAPSKPRWRWPTPSPCRPNNGSAGIPKKRPLTPFRTSQMRLSQWMSSPISSLRRLTIPPKRCNTPTGAIRRQQEQNMKIFSKTADRQGQAAGNAVPGRGKTRVCALFAVCLLGSGSAFAGDPCKSVLCLYGKFTGNSG
ncbi:Killer protein, partial [Pseudomonas syringae pv. pisi]